MSPTLYISSVPEEMSPQTALEVAITGETEPYIKRVINTDQKSSASPVVIDVTKTHIIDINRTGRLPYRSPMQPQGKALNIRARLYTPKIGAE